MQPPPNYDPSQRQPHHLYGQQDASVSVPISMPPNAWQPAAHQTTYQHMNLSSHPSAPPPQGFFVPQAPSEHQASFVPSSYPAPQSSQYAPQNAYDPMQFASQPFFSMPQGGGGASGEQAFFMPNLTPMHLMQAGTSLLAGGTASPASTWSNVGQQYVQKAKGWLSSGTLGFYFAVSGLYVKRKILLLCAPYLKRWTYVRQGDVSSGQEGRRYQPPKSDIHSPDLYLPSMALWSYVVLVCLLQLAQNKYSPESMYSIAWSGSMSWITHSILLSVALRVMSLPSSPPWLEIFAYTGYAYAPACLVLISGTVGGKWAYYIAWIYFSLCMAVFLVRTLKRAVFQEAGNYGKDLTMTNYLLLALAVFQFPLLFYLTFVQLPSISLIGHLSTSSLSPTSNSPFNSPSIGKAS